MEVQRKGLQGCQTKKHGHNLQIIYAQIDLLHLAQALKQAYWHVVQLVTGKVNDSQLWTKRTQAVGQRAFRDPLRPAKQNE
jgi:hypothetical protein